MHRTLTAHQRSNSCCVVSRRIICCIILLCISLTLTLASSTTSPSSLNTRAIHLATSSPPDTRGASALFKQAWKQEKETLYELRRELRKVMDELTETAEKDGSESDDIASIIDTTPSIMTLRSRIAQSKSSLAEYLNNEGVALMRQSMYEASRRRLEQARFHVEDHKDAVKNIGDLNRLENKSEEEAKELERKRKEKKKRRKEKWRKKSEGAGETMQDEEKDDAIDEAASPSSSSSASESSSTSDTSDRKRPPQATPIVSSSDATTKRKRRPTALDKPRRENTNVRMKLPRIHVAHLEWKENEEYAQGRTPFILLGALDQWNLTAHWSPTVFGTLYPQATVDFYPHNMDEVSVRPYLTPLQKALEEQLNPTHAYPESSTHPGSYIQWNVNWHDWSAMVKNMLPEGLPKMYHQDDTWLMELSNQCLPTRELQDEFTLRTHWRMVLIGNRGAGMFNHQDVLRTASYQAQVAGEKRWHLCDPTQSQYIGRAGGVDAFDPDYEKYPLFRQAQCYDDVVTTGEVIFYPADYWHQTENLRTPTISITGTIMDKNNYAWITEELKQECVRQKFKWGMSKELCAALQNKCFHFWRKQFGAPAGSKKREEL